MSFGIDASTLLSWYQSTSGQSTTTSSSGAGTTAVTAATAQYAPTPPWSSATKPTESKQVQAAINGAAFVNPAAAKLDLAGASTDYKNLFALYQGLSTLYSLADQASSASNTSTFSLSQLSSAFASGLSQVTQFVDDTSFNKLRLTTGGTAASETSTATTPSQPTAYDTVALNTSGDGSALVPAFQGDVQFDVTVQDGGGSPQTIHMNLADMGSTPRTMANVVDYLNGQMKAAGALTTFSINRTTAPDDTINVGGQSVTVASGQMQWGLQINTNSYETVSLSAPTTAPAVYIGQVAGNTTSTVNGAGVTTAPDAQSQLLKFQAGGATPTPAATPAYAAPDQVFTDQLGNAVNSVQATATASDGSVYVLANVNATADGSATAGGQDVALMKYDSAGNLVFQTDLGSASSASGLSLAVSADGSQVAVAGDVTGPLVSGQTQTNSNVSNSFVAVYDNQGDQVWSHETDGVAGNQANALAFGADGSLYVTGQTATAYGASLTPAATSNGYLQVFSATGTSVSNTAIGSGGVNQGSAVAVDGSDVYVAAVQNGQAVINEYDMTNPASPNLVATRNLGDLQNGNIVGLAVQNGTVYVGGSTHNGALSAGAVTSAYSGGLDAFAATFSTGLAPSSSDAIAYYGGPGDDRATGMAVSGGEVYLTGSSTGALPGEPAIGAQDGFVAQLNVAAGSVDWSQRFTGQDGKVAPTSIAVAATGASVLDQLGLPQGAVDGPVSTLLTSTTSLKVGDSFSISTNGEPPTKITIAATDTMATLSEKIRKATGSQVNVSVATTATGSNLVIKPLDAFFSVQLYDGPSGSDALTGLGLKSGMIYQTTKSNGTSVPADGKSQIYGLGLSSTLNLNSTAAISQAKSQITAAMSVIKSAYQTLKTASTPANVLALQKQQSTQGTAPAYLTAQIASYQTALARLTAGQSSSSTTTVGV